MFFYRFDKIMSVKILAPKRNEEVSFFYGARIGGDVTNLLLRRKLRYADALFLLEMLNRSWIVRFMVCLSFGALP